MRKMNWMQKLADSVDLAGEALPGIPVVEIAGDYRVLIERHKGVVEYSRERICINVCYGTVGICGSDLEVITMTKEQLVIAGKVDCVQIQRRGR